MPDLWIAFPDVHGGTQNPYASLQREDDMLQSLESLLKELTAMNLYHGLDYNLLHVDFRGVRVQFHDTTTALMFKLSRVT